MMRVSTGTGRGSFDDVVRKVDAITPVPGGVGIMTVTSLLENTLKAAELAVGKI